MFTKVFLEHKKFWDCFEKTFEKQLIFMYITAVGSVYVYTYLAIGEVVAFIVAWNIILDTLITAAVIARTLVAYLNDILDNSLRESLPEMIKETSFTPYTFFFVLPFTLVVLSGMYFLFTSSSFWRARVVFLFVDIVEL